MTELERRKFLKSTGAALAGAAGIGILTSTTCNTLTTVTCYLPGDIVERIEFSCPNCGQTMIRGEKDEILREYNVPLKRIQDQGADITLIVPEHCSQCGFGLKEAKFQLEIKYPDQPAPVRVELDTAHDLELMALFLHGMDCYDAGQEEKQALKNEAVRLRELFGVKE